MPGSQGKAPALWVTQGGSISPCLQGPQAAWRATPGVTVPSPIQTLRNPKNHFFLQAQEPLSSSSERSFPPPQKEFLKKAKPLTPSYYQIPSCQRKQQPQVAIGLCSVDFHIKIRVVVFFHGFPDGWKQQDVSDAVYFHTSSYIFEHGL